MCQNRVSKLIMNVLGKILLKLMVSAAMQELELTKQKIKIGNVVFKVFCNTPRCKATSFPYRSKILDINLPQKLNEIYNHIDFGIYLKPLTSGQVF